MIQQPLHWILLLLLHLLIPSPGRRHRCFRGCRRLAERNGRVASRAVDDEEERARGEQEGEGEEEGVGCGHGGGIEFVKGKEEGDEGGVAEEGG